MEGVAKVVLALESVISVAVDSGGGPVPVIRGAEPWVVFGSERLQACVT